MYSLINYNIFIYVSCLLLFIMRTVVPSIHGVKIKVIPTKQHELRAIEYQLNRWLRPNSVILLISACEIFVLEE